MPPTATQASAITAAYTAAQVQATTALRERLAQFVRLSWRALGVYRNAEMARFVSEVTPTVEAAMGQMSSLTSGYLAAVAQEAGHSASPVNIPTPTVQSVRGVAADVVYGRPFHQVWRDLHDGMPPAQAIDHGSQRAVQTALTDVQLAKTHTVKQSMAATPTNARPYWYKRVLEGPYSCGLCVVASTLGYHVADLMPIHPGCDCSVEPQWSAYEHTFDTKRLQDAHAAVEATFGAPDAGARAVDYRKSLIVHEHGELGPVLAVKGHAFTRL